MSFSTSEGVKAFGGGDCWRGIVRDNSVSRILG